jgi:hypothetical protein
MDLLGTKREIENAFSLSRMQCIPQNKPAGTSQRSSTGVSPFAVCDSVVNWIGSVRGTGNGEPSR